VANIFNNIKKKYIGRFKESAPISLKLLHRELENKDFNRLSRTNTTNISIVYNTIWLAKCLKSDEKIEYFRVLTGVLYHSENTTWGKWALYNIVTKKITLRSTVNRFAVPKNRLISIPDSEWYIHKTELCASHLFWKNLLENLKILKEIESKYNEWYSIKI